MLKIVLGFCATAFWLTAIACHVKSEEPMWTVQRGIFFLLGAIFLLMRQNQIKEGKE